MKDIANHEVCTVEVVLRSIVKYQSLSCCIYKNKESKWTFLLSDKILKKIEIGKKYHHSLKEHPTFTKFESLVVKCCKL